METKELTRPTLNAAYARTFQAGKLTLGLVVPIERYAASAVPTMADHTARAQQAEALGFAALWLRDVPFNVPSFGDAGQTFDPFTYLGYLAAATREIALGTASIILPLRHPAHVAKSAATADALSGGRVLLGVASGDRPEEYPAMAADFNDRAARFREAVAYIRGMAESYPSFSNHYGTPSAMDMLPKPVAGQLPLLVTGSSRQSPDWIAAQSDGWITYPRAVHAQASVVSAYRKATAACGRGALPVMQSLYVDLVSDPDASPSPIHLGFRSGSKALLAYLKELEQIGINHVALNLRFASQEAETQLHALAREILPHFAP
ncbi:MAG: LLM class oxidoreductase [Pseudomonadota bacterium]